MPPRDSGELKLRRELSMNSDTSVQWYDFGGAHFVAPAVDTEGTSILEKHGEHTLVTYPEKGDGINVAALGCTKNGKYYFKTFEGNFTAEDLTDMYIEYSPEFQREVNAVTQETQNVQHENKVTTKD